MNISLIVPVKYFSIHVDETHLEGSMSQNVDRGLSFWFIVCRVLQTFRKKIPKLPVLGHNKIQDLNKISETFFPRYACFPRMIKSWCMQVKY